MASDAVFGRTSERYLNARGAALAAVEVADGPLGRGSWDAVATALRHANAELARCDDAWLALSAAGVRMVARRGDLTQLALVWGPAVRGACRYLGPASESVATMRASCREVEPSGRERRRLDSARAKLRRAGGDGARDPDWRLAELLARYLRCDELSRHLFALVGDQPTGPARAEPARLAARMCLGVGEVETGRGLFQQCLDAETGDPTGTARSTASLRLAAGRQHLADYHVLNGEPELAEPLVQSAQDGLSGLATSGDGALELAELHDRCLATLADCALLQGDLPIAQEAYARAAEYAEAHPAVDRSAARRHGNAATYLALRLAG